MVQPGTVPLSRGLVAVVDAADLDAVMAHKWSIHDNGGGNVYAVRVERGKRIFLHRWLAGISDPSVFVDHRDGDSLNNRRCNIRVATNQQNSFNRRKSEGCSSRYKGVRLRPTGSWQTRIKHNGKQVVIGSFRDEDEAARAYDDAASRLFGEFARLNFAG